MLTSLGSVDFFPSRDPGEEENLERIGRELVRALVDVLPVPWKKIVFYFETSLNVQTVGMMFQTETGQIWEQEDLVRRFEVGEESYDQWIDSLHDICERMRAAYWNLTGESWQWLNVILTEDREKTQFRFGAEDWCDVNERLKCLLLKRREFGRIEPVDEHLMEAYRNFMAGHGGEHPGERSERELRDLLERFAPHRFTEEMAEQAQRWLSDCFDRCGLTADGKLVRELARRLLYESEANGEPLTEKTVSQISAAECRNWLCEPITGRYEYYRVPDMWGQKE